MHREREGDSITMLVGGDAPVIALSATSQANEEFRYIDDAAFSSAMSGYAPGMKVLSATELLGDLSEADVSWLRELGDEMIYNLRYWRPRSVGDVIFNTWD
jgi:hypothetical protein